MTTVRLNLPSQSLAPRSVLALSLLLSLTLPACGIFEHEYEPPPEVFPDSRYPGGSTPDPSKVEAPKTSANANEIIVDCERHILSWQFAQSQAKSARDRERLVVLEEAFAIYVRKELHTLREVAIVGDERSRGIASTALGFSVDASILPILLNNVSDSSDLIVANTLFGIGMLAAPSTPAGILAEAIQRPGTSTDLVRNGAYAATRIAKARRDDPKRGQRQDGLDDLLIYLLDRPEPSVRAQAASGLGYTQSEKAMAKLSNLLVGDPETQVRFAAAFALGEIGSKESAGDLIASLDDSDRLTVGASRAALAKIFGRDYGPDPKAWLALLR
jgi:HEAT repeat protein